MPDLPAVVLTLLTGDLARWLIVAEMFALIGITVFLHTLHGSHVAAQLLEMGRGLLWVIGVVALGVIVNALLPIPLTPGAWIVALGTAPVVVRGAVLVTRDVRASR